MRGRPGTTRWRDGSSGTRLVALRRRAAFGWADIFCTEDKSCVVFSGFVASGKAKDTERASGSEHVGERATGLRIDFSDSGRITFGARSGSHYDILLSLAIACWRLKGSGDGPRIFKILSEYVRAGETTESELSSD